MAFWNNKKKEAKKAQQQQIDELADTFTSFGNKNVAEEARAKSRSETREANEALRNKEKIKERNIDALKQLRNLSARSEKCSDVMDTIDNLIRKYKDMIDGNDVVVLSVIDNFIASCVSNGINYINRNNIVGMGACVDLLDEYINDRNTCQPYYKNKDYCNAKIVSGKLYIEVKNLTSRLIKISARGQELKARYQSATLPAEKDDILRELGSLKSEKERITTSLVALDKKKENINKVISQLEQAATVHQFDEQIDYTDLLTKGVEVKKTNEAENKLDNKFEDLLNQQDPSVSMTDLTFGSTQIEEDSTPEVNLSDFDL